MNSIVSEWLEQLLAAISRQVLALRVAQALRTASWIISALVLSAALVHFFLHSLDARWLLPLAATPAVIALVTMARRPSRFECADWADRHLQGNSAFSTFLEAGNVGGHIFRDVVQSGFERIVKPKDAEKLTRTTVAILKPGW